MKLAISVLCLFLQMRVSEVFAAQGKPVHVKPVHPKATKAKGADVKGEKKDQEKTYGVPHVHSGTLAHVQPDFFVIGMCFEHVADAIDS